jgi:hypothetical protein
MIFGGELDFDFQILHLPSRHYIVLERDLAAMADFISVERML